MREIVIHKNGRGGDYRKCDYPGCGETPRHRVHSFIGRNPSIILSCTQHRRYFEDCERSFADLRREAYELYGESQGESRVNRDRKYTSTDYGFLPSGGKKCAE